MYFVRLLTDDVGFRNGLGFGLVVLVALTAMAALGPGRTPHSHPLRLAALTATIATVAALDRTGPSVLLRERLVWGLAILAVMPMVAAIVARPASTEGRVGGALLAVPGAILVASACTVDNPIDWVPWFVLAAVVVGGLLVVDFDEAYAFTGLPPVLMGLTGLAIWTTVPDTEQVLVLVGVLLPMMLLGWPIPRAAQGAAAYAVVGLVAWVAAVGGRGRPGAVVGAVACLGVFLVEPLVRRCWRGRAVVPRRPFEPRSVATVGVHAVVLLVTARIAGLETSARTAALIAALGLAAGAAALAVVMAPRPRPPAEAERNSAVPPRS